MMVRLCSGSARAALLAAAGFRLNAVTGTGTPIRAIEGVPI